MACVGRWGSFPGKFGCHQRSRNGDSRGRSGFYGLAGKAGPAISDPLPASHRPPGRGSGLAQFGFEAGKAWRARGASYGPKNKISLVLLLANLNCNFYLISYGYCPNWLE